MIGNNKNVYGRCYNMSVLISLIMSMSLCVYRGIDMLKDGISVPGLTMKYLFQNLDEYFTLPDEQNSDVYWLIKSNIVGGPSIIFHRYHEAGATFLRPEEYGEEARRCASIVGYDANALYLWALSQEMPTGFPIRRHAPDFKPVQTRKKGIADQWLSYMAHAHNIHIRHRLNHYEKRFGARRLPVDGWCQETQTIYQFHGCLWHGCECVNASHNPVTGKSMQELREETTRNTQYLKSLGFTVVEMRECEWRRLRQHDPEIKAFVRRLPAPPRAQLTQDQIIEGIRDGTFFGMAEVDIHVPDHLKKHFAEMTPIFKNTELTRDHIGPFMRHYAEQHDMMKVSWFFILINHHGGEDFLIS